MSVEIDDLMDARRLSGLQWYVLVLCTLAVLFDGYDLQVLALTVPALTKAWGVAPASLSRALSASLLGMGLGAALLGPLGDRYGRRTVLAATLATELTLVFVRRKNLLVAGTGAREMQAAQLRVAAAVFVIVLSIGLAWVNTDVAKYCWLLLAVAPAAADRWSTSRRARR